MRKEEKYFMIPFEEIIAEDGSRLYSDNTDFYMILKQNETKSGSHVCRELITNRVVYDTKEDTVFNGDGLYFLTRYPYDTNITRITEFLSELDSKGIKEPYMDLIVSGLNRYETISRSIKEARKQAKKEKRIESRMSKREKESTERVAKSNFESLKADFRNASQRVLK